MRLPLSILSLFVGASVPALAVTLSGKIIDPSGVGKSGVTVSFQGAKAISGTDGTWSLSGNSTGISSRLSGSRQVTAGGHLVLDEGHLRVSLSGYDLMGRPRAGSTVATVPTGTASGVSARATTAGVDTILYSWNGKTFLQDTASASRSGIVGIFDTTWNANIIYGWLIDPRDEQVYRTVNIAGVTWMAQNLNYASSGSRCYNLSNGNCSTFGRLYDWIAAMAVSSQYVYGILGAHVSRQGVCPNGWHISSDSEWQNLEAAIGLGANELFTQGYRGYNKAAKLISSSLWNGNDTFGFRALPGGQYNPIGITFLGGGTKASFWTSNDTDYLLASAIQRRITGEYGSSIARLITTKTSGSSVRCIAGNGVGGSDEPVPDPTPSVNNFTNTSWRYSTSMKTTTIDKSDTRVLYFANDSTGTYSKIGYNYSAIYSSYLGAYEWSTCCGWNTTSAFHYSANGNSATILMGGITTTATLSGTRLIYDGAAFSH